MAYALPGPAAFAAPGQRYPLQVPEASRGEAGRAAAAVYSKAKDGGTLSRHLLLSESHRRRVRSCAPNLRTSLPKKRRNLGFLGGRRIRTVPPTGAKVRQRRTPKRAFGYFSRVGKVPRPGGRNSPSPIKGKKIKPEHSTTPFQSPPQSQSKGLNLYPAPRQSQSAWDGRGRPPPCPGCGRCGR